MKKTNPTSAIEISASELISQSDSPYLKYVNKKLLSRIPSTQALSYAGMTVERILHAAIADQPKQTEAYSLLAKLLQDRGAFMEAAGIYQRLLQIDAYNAAAFLNLLHCQLSMGAFTDAEQTYQKLVVNHDDTLITPTLALEYLRLSISAERFSELTVADYDLLFFVKYLTRDFSKNLQDICFVMMDQFFEDYIAQAKRIVESAGGIFTYVSIDDLFAVENKSDVERMLLDEVASTYDQKKGGNRINWLKSNPSHMQQMHQDINYYSADYLDQIFSGPKQTLQAVRVVMGEWQSEYLNVKNGMRVTTDCPTEWDRRVVMVGASDAYGFGCEDAKTVASFLQRELNRLPDLGRVKVENYGMRGAALPIAMANLTQLQINPGDVVVFFGYPQLSPGYEIAQHIDEHHISMSRPHSHGEVFIDQSHFGWRGNQVIATQLNDYVKTLFENPPISTEDSVAESVLSYSKGANVSVEFFKYLLYRKSAEVVEVGDLKEYVDYVETLKQTGVENVGSVAVNCNPITLGHLHLLEYAASKVDYLFIFVIEEDQSFFAFEDRMRLVSEATAHMPNVTVLRGGKYICTEITFPEYFNKDEVNDIRADAAMEAWFFCEYIAKALNIKTIFLGDEPNCLITRQYNERMAAILPEYGVEVDIIDRIEGEFGVISASTVRAFLKQRDFEAIKAIVPRCTYDFLVESYG